MFNMYDAVYALMYASPLWYWNDCGALCQKYWEVQCRHLIVLYQRHSSFPLLNRRPRQLESTYGYL